MRYTHLRALESRARPVIACVCFLIAALVPSTSEGRRKCDPLTSTTPVPVPARLARRCGNGRIDTFARSCQRSCVHGCGHQGCSVGCDEEVEACDRANTSGQTCASLGFAGGQLGCAPDCGVLELRRCEPCFASQQVSCAEMGLGALREAGAPLVAARTSDVAIVFEARPSQRRPHAAYLAILEPDLRVRSRPHAIASIVPLGHRGVGIAPTATGYLIATTEPRSPGSGIYGPLDVVVRLVDPRSRARTAPITWRSPNSTLVDLVVTSTGEPALIMVVQGSQPTIEVRLLDARGMPRPLPDAPMHAVGHERLGVIGRLFVAPLGSGTIRAPDGSSIAAGAGDHLVIWTSYSSQLAASGIGLPSNFSVSIQRADTRVGGFRHDAPGGRAELDLALPGGAHLTLAHQGLAFDDAYTRGAAPMHVTGSLRAEPAVRVFGGQNLTSAFASTPTGSFGVTYPTPDGRGPERLVLARIRR